MTIHRETVQDILDATCPQYDNGQRVRSLTTSVRATGYAHGLAAGAGDPWDHTNTEMTDAIAQYFGEQLARDYCEQYWNGRIESAQRRNQRIRAARD